MRFRVLFCATVGLCRLLELGWSRRNMAGAGPAREGRWSRRTFPLIVTLHAAVIAGTLVRGESRPHASWLAAFIAAQPLRAWTLLTLGRWWNVRGSVAEGTEVVTNGPYRYVRHPNYTVVAIEIASLPPAFGLGRLGAAAAILNAALLMVRIREEEAMLFALPGYRRHFGTKPRFLPLPSRR
jgi:methyltransferase